MRQLLLMLVICCANLLTAQHYHLTKFDTNIDSTVMTYELLQPQTVHVHFGRLREDLSMSNATNIIDFNEFAFEFVHIEYPIFSRECPLEGVYRQMEVLKTKKKNLFIELRYGHDEGNLLHIFATVTGDGAILEFHSFLMEFENGDYIYAYNKPKYSYNRFIKHKRPKLIKAMNKKYVSQFIQKYEGLPIMTITGDHFLNEQFVRAFFKKFYRMEFAFSGNVGSEVCNIMFYPTDTTFPRGASRDSMYKWRKEGFAMTLYPTAKELRELLVIRCMNKFMSKTNLRNTLINLCLDEQDTPTDDARESTIRDKKFHFPKQNGRKGRAKPDSNRTV